MGYYMESREINFKIKSENADKALEAIKDYVKSQERISWVYEEEVLKADKLTDALHEFRWESIEYNNCIEISCFIGEKYSTNDEEMFSAIAPYVEDESYIVMQGEDSYMWRWFFKNGEMEEQTAKITWE